MINLKKDTTLLFLGDSITHGGRCMSMDGNHIMGHGYASIIASRLGYDNLDNMPKFINKGVSGEAISQIYSRLYTDVLQNKPDIISILAGINDIGKGLGMPYKMTTDKYIKIYQMMIDDIRAVLDNPKIIICEPFYLELTCKENPYKNTPYAMCEEYYEPGYVTDSDDKMVTIRKEITYMQEQLKIFAKDNNCIYVPLQEEFYNAAKKSASEYLIWDTIHPTIAGHELIARKWLETIESTMESMK